ncbi:MAG: hypothetical protein J6X85_00765, partial [Ruminococcus sp.]|nr:hypothetical protein [Ruminococcus sp.]
SGLGFKGGLNSYENESIEDIMEWNQKKLEEDFELGYDEDASNDYKQMRFEYDGFSELRGFIMNESPIRGEYTFTLLIPQEEVHVEGDTYKKEAVEKLKAIASKLWILPKTRTMQTELELGEGITPEMDIKEGAAPSACPFAIVSEKQFGRMDTADYTAEHIEYGGVILTPNRIKLV